MNRKKQIVVIFTMVSLGLCTPSLAKMYKWADDKGQVHFSNQKPEKAQQLYEYGTDVKPSNKQHELDLKVIDIGVKYLRRSGKYVNFSLRIDVRCTDPKFRGDVKVWVRALDRKGFELDTAIAQGKIGPGSRAVVSGANHWRYKLYKQIHKWEITSITFD